MKTKNLLLLLLLTLSMTNGLMAAKIPFPTTGTGILGNPYIINNPADLLAVRDSINKTAGATGVATAYYQLGANIDMINNEWLSSIGSSISSANFKGNFNGNGFKISNLHCGYSYAPNALSSFTGNFGFGLFGQLAAGATIRNLTLDNLSFYINRSNSYYGYVGGIAGWAIGGVNTIDNCNVSGIISVTNSGTVATGSPTQKVGGIIGALSQTPELYVTNCWTNVQLTNIGSSTNGATPAVGTATVTGGIIGEGNITSITGFVNCYSLGSITATSSFGGCTAGGIVGGRIGAASAGKTLSIINCYSAMTIDASEFTLLNTGIGGITGLINASPAIITNCIALNPSLSLKTSNAGPIASNLNLCRVGSKNTVVNTAFSSNYALNSMAYTGTLTYDITPTTGTPAIVDDNTGADGATLTGPSAAQVTASLGYLNTYADANNVYATSRYSTMLASWKTGTTYPTFIPFPAIAFPLVTVSKTTSDAAFTQTATSNSSAAITYASSNPLAATVDANTGAITLVAAGTTTITATQAAATGFSRGLATYSLVVTAPSAVALVEVPNLKVSSVNGVIIVSGNEGKAIELYNVLGKKVSAIAASQNETTKLSLNGKGIFLVKVANRTVKVIL